jgi:hypothetical protein
MGAVVVMAVVLIMAVVDNTAVCSVALICSLRGSERKAKIPKQSIQGSESRSVAAKPERKGCFLASVCSRAVTGNDVVILAIAHTWL